MNYFQTGPIKAEMDSEQRSPRQWARDTLSPFRMISIVGVRIIRHMTGVG